MTISAFVWPLMDLMSPIMGYILGDTSENIRPIIDLKPILHPFINVGKCFEPEENVPFTITLNIKKTIISVVESYEKIRIETERSFLNPLGKISVHNLTLDSIMGQIVLPFID